MFIPGLWGGAIWAGLGKQVNCCLFAILWILSSPFFPLVVIGTKLLGLFNPGPELKKLCTKVNEVEGSGESTVQFSLQMTMVMSRKDRVPSNRQSATILASFFALNKLNKM